MGTAGFIAYLIFVVSLGIGFLLIVFTWWHARMISRGVTSVERLLYQGYTQQCADQNYVFVNPFDVGLLENWKRFFNIRTVREFILRVLLPSTHKPRGNGIIWSGYNLQSHRSDLRSSTRPIAFPPDAYLNFYVNYPINTYRSVIMLPWPNKHKSANTSADHEPNTPSTETIDSMKDR
jgi:hypothetical protein